MGLSVNSIKDTSDLSSLIQQINRINNEMAQDLNMLKEALRNKDAEVSKLNQDINSLNVRLGEFSAHRLNVKKKVSGKNYKFGETDSSTVDINTLFVDGSGSLIFENKSGVATTLVP